MSESASLHLLRFVVLAPALPKTFRCILINGNCPPSPPVLLSLRRSCDVWKLCFLPDSAETDEDLPLQSSDAPFSVLFLSSV